LELLQAVLPEMRQRGFGRILTLASVNQTSPEGLLSVYAALKSAQYNLSINLAREYAPYGITVNNLSPGLIATERNKFRRQDAAAWAQIEAGCCPMQRAGRASEMAAAALLLCSDAGSYITGADLQATGGRIWRGRRKTRAIRQTPRAPVDSGLPLNPSDAAIAGRDRP
jgi:NAD(P)-dependent dehydrogenase (short-subunit alcohol dehydrogenase family)